MAQKSFPTLNKIDTAMTWISNINSKRFNWLSNNYWLLCFLLFKTIILLQTRKTNFLWLRQKNNPFSFIKNKNKLIKNKNKKRFSIFYTIYIVDFNTHLLIICLHFAADLRYFKGWKAMTSVDSNKNIIKENFLQKEFDLNFKIKSNIVDYENLNIDKHGLFYKNNHYIEKDTHDNSTEDYIYDLDVISNNNNLEKSTKQNTQIYCKINKQTKKQNVFKNKLFYWSLSH